MSEILIVDDEHPIRVLLQEILRKADHNVIAAINGQEAIDLIQQNNFDLVISDMHMGKLGGIDVLHAAKERNPLTEVVILTGFGSISTAVEAMQLGAFVYLTKPIDIQEFRLKIQQALERKDLREQIAAKEYEIREHQELIERDLQLAAQIQRSILPVQITNKKFDVAIRHYPMIGVGGDFSDIYYNEESEIYLTIVDVTGHGIAAALLVNRICMEIRRLVREQLEPASILYYLNDFIVDSFEGTGMFLTMFSCALNVNTGSLRFAGSAHPPIVLWRKEANRFEFLESQNQIIGFEKVQHNSFKQNATVIEAEDKLFLYTDGLLEIENQKNKPLGIDGLVDLLRSGIFLNADEISDHVLSGMQSFAHGVQRDDIYLIVCNLK
ncbi:MAG: response regulator [Calditrichaeota bacterium]|nr:MAG: response regulator [Calditrichota bacterium]